jgi:hypothetical protein
VNQLPEWVQWILAICFAALSGAVAYLQQFVKPAPERPAFEPKILFIKVLTSGTAGFFLILLLWNKGLDKYLLGFMVGVAGWGGAETIAIFSEVFRGVINRTAQGPKDNGPKA